MSFHYYSIDGYGVEISKLECEMWKDKPVNERLELLKSYLDINAPKCSHNFFEFVNQVNNEEGSNADWDTYMEFDEDYCIGLATILATAMREKYLIYFTSCNDFDGNTYIVYEPPYPWNMLPEEKELTKDKLENMLSELTESVFGKCCKGGYLSVENGG